MGTGLAAGYVDSGRNLSTDILGEMGNVVIDLSANAQGHTFTDMKGVLQVYLSHHSVVRVAERLGINFGKIPDEDRAKHVSLQLKTNKKNIAVKTYEELGRYLATAIVEVSQYLTLKRVFITGGVTTGDAGKILCIEKAVLKKRKFIIGHIGLGKTGG